MTLPAINFEEIRTHRGTQHGGFEELCCQLAHLEACPGGRFFRKGEGGDAGVECFWRLADASEHGWQAKYLFELGNSEASQLNKSFLEAFGKHPRLSRYVVCLPFDLSDARAVRKGRPLKSQLGRWNELAAKWMKHASQEGRSIEIELWSASQVASLLEDVRPEYAGKALYWFGSPSLSPDMLRERVEIAIQNLGPRYTPESHVQLPIAQALDGLCWHEVFRELVRERWRQLQQAANDCRREIDGKIGLEAAEAACSKALSTTKYLADALEVLANDCPNAEAVDHLRQALDDAAKRAARLTQQIFDIGRERVDDGGEPIARVAATSNDQINRARYVASKLRSSVSEVEQLVVSHQVSASATRALLVRGEAGTGKSHLLADVALARVKFRLPTVLVLGQNALVDRI